MRPACSGTTSTAVEVDGGAAAALAVALAVGTAAASAVVPEESGAREVPGLDVGPAGAGRGSAVAARHPSARIASTSIVAATFIGPVGRWIMRPRRAAPPGVAVGARSPTLTL